MNLQVLTSFQDAHEQRNLDDAYVYGMRYSTFCLQCIPRHDYYKSSKYKQRVQAMQIQVEKVLTLLEKVSELMDAEEVEKERQRQAMLKKQLEERQRRQRLEEQRRFDEFEKRMRRQQTSSSSSSTMSLEESALAKLQRLTSTGDQEVDKNQITRPEEPDGIRIDGDLSDNDLPPPLLPPSDGDSLPTPMAPPGANGDIGAAPPSYDQALQVRQSSYFGPGQALPKGSSQRKFTPAPVTQEANLPSYDQIIKKQQPKKPKAKPNVPVRKLIEYANREYSNYQRNGKITIGSLGTYQGRVDGSTNGCTVISALVVAHHLHPGSSGVSSKEVDAVIDRECGPILKQIRRKLQLPGCSLIIPSDVHDHLVDSNILFQHKFVGAAGGNILDSDHLEEVLTLLEGSDKDKTRHLKAGATLFFKEHVISIVKFPTGPTTAVYDLIDSLPSGMFRGGTRTRCQDIGALRVLLKWYSSKKFSDSNCTYIDRHPKWDDMMADFDPRVFQAFVWADIPKPKNSPKQ